MSLTHDHRLWVGKKYLLEDGSTVTHPATFHSLDVAACVKLLLEQNPNWLRRLSEGTKIPEDDLKNFCVLMIALHDIGKLSEKFSKDIGEPAPETSATNDISSLRHWEISYQMFEGDLKDDILALTNLDKRCAKHIFAAVAGHHGKPPQLVDMKLRDTVGIPAAKEFIKDLARILPRPKNKITFEEVELFSWSLAGLTTTSDWLGSNQHWFRAESPTMDVEEYWNSRALFRATKSVKRAGLVGSKIAKDVDIATVFGITTPRPLQKAVADIEIMNEPTLIILEDMTGSGKTEAAITLAARMMQKGLGEGMYISLPTTAMANSMYNRFKEDYRKIFEPDETPSIALAHGKRTYNDGFRDAVSFAKELEFTSLEDDSVSAACASWIADDRRLTFLAEIGIGTIDQAFMGILPMKFSALRTFGLSQKILIVDEAHACDTYMHEELVRTLEMQATLRGSAIVMTATLTDQQRNSLVAAFRRGLGLFNSVSVGTGYPSYSVVDSNRCYLQKIEHTKSLERIVPVNRLDNDDEAIKLLVEAAEKGAACVWIRNTVDSVVSAANKLRDRGCDVEIFHARFALCDRLEVENYVVDIFGKNGDREERKGKILVASQVVEASLDLDFDVMVSDIAPIDSIIQRIGRLWRHVDMVPPRNRFGYKCELNLICPDPSIEDIDLWTDGTMKGNHIIYGACVLWRTAKAIFSTGHGAIDSPFGLPTLIEGVMGKTAPDVPEDFVDAEDKMMGKYYAHRQIAKGAMVNINSGYMKSSGAMNEKSATTRIGPPSITVTLIKRNSLGELQFWKEDDIFGGLSEMNLMLYKFDSFKDSLPDLPSDLGILTGSWSDTKLKYSTFIFVDEFGLISPTVRYDRKSGLLTGELF